MWSVQSPTQDAYVYQKERAAVLFGAVRKCVVVTELVRPEPTRLADAVAGG